MDLDRSSTAFSTARRRWCWVWVVALVCLHPAAAWAGSRWSRAGIGETDEALEKVRLQRVRAGERADADALQALRQTHALVKVRSRLCPVELDVINGSDHAMWHVRLAVSGTTGGKTTERQLHIPLLPAGSKTSLEVFCGLWSATGKVSVSVPPAVPGSALGPDIVREMLSARADHLFKYETYQMSEQPSDESAAASALAILLEETDQDLLRALAAQLLAEPAGAGVLASVLVSPAPALLDGDKVVAAAREGKIDLFAAVELDRILRRGCADTVKSLRGCAEAIQRLGPGARELLTPRFFAAMSPELKRQLSFLSTPAAQEVADVTRELRASGLDTGPIVQHLCDEMSLDSSPHSRVAGRLLDLAERIDPEAPCVVSWRSVKRREDLLGLASTLGTLGIIVLPAPLLMLHFRRRWRRLRSRLGLDTKDDPGKRSAPEGVIGPRLAEKRWTRAFEGGVSDLRRGLDADESEACRAAAEAIGRAMDGHGAAIAESARGCVIDALTRGTAQSFLARLEGLLLYVLVIPSAHAEPRALVRYAPLSDGWTGHAGRVADGAPAMVGAKRPLLALVLFVRSDASEVTLVAGYDDGERRVWPGPLLDAGEASRVEGRVYPDQHDFTIERA